MLTELYTYSAAQNWVQCLTSFARLTSFFSRRGDSEHQYATLAQPSASSPSTLFSYYLWTSLRSSKVIPRIKLIIFLPFFLPRKIHHVSFYLLDQSSSPDSWAWRISEISACVRYCVLKGFILVTSNICTSAACKNVSSDIAFVDLILTNVSLQWLSSSVARPCGLASFAMSFTIGLRYLYTDQNIISLVKPYLSSFSNELRKWSIS